MPTSISSSNESKPAVKAAKSRKKSLLKLPKYDNSALRSPAVVDGSSSTCGCCNKKFRLKYQYLSHQITQQGKKMCCAVAGCSLTDQEFSSVRLLELHLQEHTGELGLTCNLCSRTFTSELARNRHVATHEEGEFSCPHCRVSQPSRIVLNMHQRYCSSRGEPSQEDQMVVGEEDIVVFVEDQNGAPSDQTETVIMM